MIMVATGCHPRKAYSAEMPQHLENLTYTDKLLYYNAQDMKFPLDKEKWIYDEWSWPTSNWQGGAKFDQDVGRLEPIVMFRNMALAAARRAKASHILFVDSDVIVPPDSIERLLEIDKPLVGGLVPGRGKDEKEFYVFGERNSFGYKYKRCNHGTMGFCMISKKIFSLVSFRTGYVINFWKRPKPYTDWAAEDPMYAEDSEAMRLHDGWILDMSLLAEHHDDPNNPLTAATAAPNYDVNS